MAKKNYLAAVVAGIFIVGVITGYLFSQYQTSRDDMYSLLQNPQNMQVMHDLINKDPEIKRQITSMITNSAKGETKNIRDVDDIIQSMKSDHDFMMKMMMAMINDPQLRIHMIGHMTENNETMKMMAQVVNTPTKEIMDNDTMSHIINDPDKRKEMIDIMAELEQELSSIQSQKLNEEEYIQKANIIIQKHISRMQELVNRIQNHHSDAH